MAQTEKAIVGNYGHLRDVDTKKPPHFWSGLVFRFATLLACPHRHYYGGELSCGEHDGRVWSAIVKPAALIASVSASVAFMASFFLGFVLGVCGVIISAAVP